MKEQKGPQRPIDQMVSTVYSDMRKSFSLVPKGRVKFFKWTGIALFAIGFLSGVVYVANPVGFTNGLRYLSGSAMSLTPEPGLSGRFPTTAVRFTSPTSTSYGAGEGMNITWTGLKNSRVALVLYKGNENCTYNKYSYHKICGTPFYSSNHTIGTASSANNVGVYYWTIPANLAGTDFRITGVDIRNPQFVFQSSPFSVVQRSVFISPTSKQFVTAGSRLSISWKSGANKLFDLYLYKGNNNCRMNDITGSYVCGTPFYSKDRPIVRRASGNYVWSVPRGLTGSDFHITAVENGNPPFIFQSPAFTIGTKPITPPTKPFKPPVYYPTF